MLSFSISVFSAACTRAACVRPSRRRWKGPTRSASSRSPNSADGEHIRGKEISFLSDPLPQACLDPTSTCVTLCRKTSETPKHECHPSGGGVGRPPPSSLAARHDPHTPSTATLHEFTPHSTLLHTRASTPLFTLWAALPPSRSDGPRALLHAQLRRRRHISIKASFSSRARPSAPAPRPAADTSAVAAPKAICNVLFAPLVVSDRSTCTTGACVIVRVGRWAVRLMTRWGHADV